MSNPDTPAPGAPPPRAATEELGLDLTDLLEAEVTIVVGGKGEEPDVTLEIELKSGRTVTRPLHEHFVDESRRIRVKALADWLHLDQATAVDALAGSNAQAAEFVDRDRLADQLQVKPDAPLSSLPVTLHKGRRSGWTMRVRPPWTGLTRLPLGTVTALATDEKVDWAPPAGAAAVAYDAPGDPVSAPGRAAAPDGEDRYESNEGCVGWFIDHWLLAAAGAAGLVVVAAGLFLLADPGSDDGSESGGGRGAAAVLAVDQYADRACGIFAAKVVDPNERFQAALEDAAAAPAATAALYEEISGASSEFADGLTGSADQLEEVPAPDVEGGRAAHDAVVADYRAAATAVARISAAADAYDPATATQADTVALGEEVNDALTEVNDTLGAGPEVPEIVAAFEASTVCANLVG